MVLLTGASLEKNATPGFNVYLREPNNLDGLAEEQHERHQNIQRMDP